MSHSKAVKWRTVLTFFQFTNSYNPFPSFLWNSITPTKLLHKTLSHYFLFIDIYHNVLLNSQRGQTNCFQQPCHGHRKRYSFNILPLNSQLDNLTLYTRAIPVCWTQVLLFYLVDLVPAGV